MNFHFLTQLLGEGSRTLSAVCVFTISMFLLLSGCPVQAQATDESSELLIGDAFEDDVYAFDASDAEEYTTEVHGVAIVSTDDTTAAAETHQTRQFTESVQSVSEVLRSGVGVQVRQTGGAGSSSTVQIRGSSSSQVAVYLDGIPLNTGGNASVNLGELNLDLFESIEVYRGTVPLQLGLGSIGGAVALNSRSTRDAQTELSGSAGSFRTFRTLAVHSTTVGKTQYLVLLSSFLSAGNFRYLNSNGTQFTDADDVIQERENNHHESVATFAKASRRIGSWRVRLINSLSVQQNGVPGIDTVPTTKASLRTLLETVGISGERMFSPHLTVLPTLSYLYHRYGFEDPLDEIGIGHQDVTASSNTVSAGLVVNVTLNDSFWIENRVEGTRDWFSISDALSTDPSSDGTRLQGGWGSAVHWLPVESLEVVPSVRLKGYLSAHTGAGGLGNPEIRQTSGSEHHVLPAVGIKKRLSDVFQATGNLGKYVREPDLFELYGNSGTVDGNSDLVSETGLNADFGLSAMAANTPAFSHLRWYGGVFGAWSKHLIAYTQNSQKTIHAENVAAARATGVETSLTAGVSSWLRVHVNYTWLQTVNRSDYPFYNGRRLPGKPAHEGYLRMDWMHRFGVGQGILWMDVDVAGDAWLSQANIEDHILGRALLGTGAKFSHAKSGLTLTLEVKNLLNQIVLDDAAGESHPLRDFAALPLPGRSLFVTLNWKS